MDGDGERRIERIVALLDIGRHADAADAARVGLTGDPQSATLHHLLAQALSGLEDVPAALHHARAAVSLEPESADALELLALTLAEAGEDAQAREAAVRAVHLAPDEWLSHALYAHVLLVGNGGRAALDEAERAARRAIELGPHEPAPHVCFGIVRWRRDDVAMAEQAFQHALTLDPSDADAQRNLALLHLSWRDFDTGAQTLTRALASNPQDQSMHGEADRALRQVLASVSFWFMAAAASLGGFMLATDFLWRQRAGTPVVALLVLGAAGVKRAASLPGTKSRLLPWRAPRGQRVATALHWLCITLALAVFFAPDGPAALAWAAVAAALVLRTTIFWTRVLRADASVSAER